MSGAARATQRQRDYRGDRLTFGWGGLRAGELGWAPARHWSATRRRAQGYQTSDARFLAANGGDAGALPASTPGSVSERLGHATIAITRDTYSHAIPAMQEEAAALIAGLVFAGA